MKKFLSILICGCLTLGLTACGGGTGASDTGTSVTPASLSVSEEEPVVSDSISEEPGQETTVETEPAEESGSQALIAELEAKYADVESDELTWDYNSSTRTIIISGEGPMREYKSEAPEWDVYSEEAEHVIIGDEVTSIGAGAFMWFGKLSDVAIGEKVEFIGDISWTDCFELRKVNFPEGLKYIGESAFTNALLHTDNGFVFPEGLLYVGKEAFYSAFKESFVYVPASLEVIGERAWSNCFVDEFRISEDNGAYASIDGVMYDKAITTLLYYPAAKTDKSYEIPETVRKIVRESIETNNCLESITVPASVEEIEQGAIFWNYALKNIYVDEKNENFISDNGVLYTRDYSKLLCCPISSDRAEYTVKDGTEEICDYAVSQAGNLKKIHIPEGVRRIGEYAFYFSEGLSEAGLPESLETIDCDAFDFCYSLSRINYGGSSESWAGITINEGNDPLTNGQVTIYPAY